jgi:hypothetical protein
MLHIYYYYPLGGHPGRSRAEKEKKRRTKREIAGRE